MTQGPTQDPTQEPRRVLLIDDHDLIRQGLARAFERQEDFVVAGQAASVAEGLRQFGALSRTS
jgi:DNA-binding NarL/FixJ family response regulator